MKTYAITPGSKLIFSVDMAPWETVTFKAGDFGKPRQATAAELAAVLNRSGSLSCYSDSDDALVLASADRGDGASLEIDTQSSTAAAALGITQSPVARGSGASAARLVGQAAQPFALPDGSEMTITVDGKRSPVVFNGLAKGASAADVAKAIDAALAGIARARRDGRVMLVSPTTGPDSMLAVDPADPAGGKPDAAAILGFIGASAFSRPIVSEPARMLCSGVTPQAQLVNLTATPIELHLSTGKALLPARGSIAMGPADAAHGPLQRMIARGMVRIARGN